jgi:serine/threonine-protein kinase
MVGKVFSACTVVRKLGQGGMGAVYLAKRSEDDAEVVIKFLDPRMAMNPDWRARFLREARVMQRIAHENIVGIYALEGEGDRPHIVIEYVNGEPLDEVVNRGPLEPIQATRIGLHVAEALAHAHTAGIIHRDIKPANVLLNHDGRVKVLDFGLAKSAEGDDQLSMAGQVLGTPHYMAPEQWGTHAVDARCDIFSLGAMLYHLVTGSVPFPGKKPGVVYKKVMKGIMQRPRELAPTLPEDLELVILKAMDRDRRYRYPNAKECAQDLQRILDGEHVDVPKLIVRKGPDAGKRHALLPGDSFVVGRDESCQVPIVDRSVSRQHARIERGKTGYVIHDLGSTYGTFVGGMRVRDVVLKDRDELRFGKVTVEFRDGGLGRATLAPKAVPADRMQVRTVPQPFVDALVDLQDRRAVLSLLERLAPRAVEDAVERTRTSLRVRFGGEVAENASKLVERALKRATSRAPSQLFAITHENGGDDVERWLTWWDHVRSTYPRQLAPMHSATPTCFEVLEGEPEPRTIELSNEPMFGIGREDCAVQLRSRSVSRLHATLFRFDRRHVIRDEGSRFGTLLNGERVRMAFLRYGDELSLGKVKLRFEVQSSQGAETFVHGRHGVDPEVFMALSEIGHASTAKGLIAFLERAADLGWVAAEAERLFPQDAAKRAELEKTVEAAYREQAKLALARLPKVLPGQPSDDPAAWRQRFEAQKKDLPVQLLPQGWFPAD